MHTQSNNLLYPFDRGSGVNDYESSQSRRLGKGGEDSSAGAAEFHLPDYLNLPPPPIFEDFFPSSLLHLFAFSTSAEFCKRTTRRTNWCQLFRDRWCESQQIDKMPPKNANKKSAKPPAKGNTKVASRKRKSKDPDPPQEDSPGTEEPATPVSTRTRKSGAGSKPDEPASSSVVPNPSSRGRGRGGGRGRGRGRGTGKAADNEAATSNPEKLDLADLAEILKSRPYFKTSQSPDMILAVPSLADYPEVLTEDTRVALAKQDVQSIKYDLPLNYGFLPMHELEKEGRPLRLPWWNCDANGLDFVELKSRPPTASEVNKLQGTWLGKDYPQLTLYYPLTATAYTMPVLAQILGFAHVKDVYQHQATLGKLLMLWIWISWHQLVLL